MKYRKKPVVIEAFIYGIDAWPDWFENGVDENMISIFPLVGNRQSYCQILTLEGEMIGRHGDYIIQGVKGEVYPCRSGVFELTYDKVN